MPQSALADIKFEGAESKQARPLAIAAFITLHAGIFMGVHFLFLWELFAGPWRGKIHGVGGFVDTMIVGTGLWLPLAVLFVVRGALMTFDAVKPRLMRLFNLAPGRAEQRETLSPGESLLLGLYARIFVMQVTILVGAWFALLLGTPGAYALLIIVKTAIDIAFQVFGDAIFKALRKAKAKAEAERQG
jgi:hypothetical protein